MTTSRSRRYSCLRLADEEAEAQRGEVTTYPSLHNWQVSQRKSSQTLTA